jgi:hypothetical protein
VFANVDNFYAFYWRKPITFADFSARSKECPLKPKIKEFEASLRIFLSFVPKNLIPNSKKIFFVDNF